MPVVMLTGARQVGKTTLARGLLKAERTYHTFDDALTREAARTDPASFVRGLSAPVTLDEIQKVPALLDSIKMRVDERRVPGDFLLTGSANVLLLPLLSDSLAGRMQPIAIWPLSQPEIEGKRGLFLGALFREHLDLVSAGSDDGNLARRIMRGGYPRAALPQQSDAAAFDFIGSLLTTLLERDVRDIAQIEDTVELQRLLRVLAARPASLLNVANLTRDAALPRTTVRRYLTVLERAYLIFRLQPWSKNRGDRFVKTPKVYFVDTAVASYEARISARRLESDPYVFGPLLENFVAAEICKMQTWTDLRTEVFHYRTHDGTEADLLVEADDGRCVIIEVKSSRNIRREQLTTLLKLRESLGKSFVRAIVLYRGDEIVELGERVHAVPLAALWSN